MGGLTFKKIIDKCIMSVKRALSRIFEMRARSGASFIVKLEPYHTVEYAEICTLVQILERNVTKFSPHMALKSICVRQVDF